MKLFIVDDSEPLRERLALAAAEIEGVNFVGHAGNAREALDGIRRLRPEVVILDIRMPGGGISLLEALKRETPTLRVIMFTNHDLPQYREYCRAAGADHFFTKSADFPKLLEHLTWLARQPQSKAIATASTPNSN